VEILAFHMGCPIFLDHRNLFQRTSCFLTDKQRGSTQKSRDQRELEMRAAQLVRLLRKRVN